MSASSGGSGGVGFIGLLTILFIGLKLGGVISWSWWWVLAPVWISAVVALIGLVIAVIVASQLVGRP